MSANTSYCPDRLDSRERLSVTKFISSVDRALARRLDALLDRLERRRQIDALAAMDDRLLSDVGLGRADVERLRRQS